MTPEEKKEAKRLYDIEYRKLNKEKIKKQKEEWYKNNPDKIIEQIERNKENKKIADKNYAKKNKIKLNQKKQEWAKANPEKITKAKTDYVKKMMKTDILYKLKHYIRVSINQTFKKNGFTKKSRTHEILGCSYDEFKTHIESLFEPWMNWDNQGNWNGIPTELNTAWDIDHIIPTSTAMTEEDVIRLNHYTNLQPLCSYYNRNIKKDKH
jgi:hypothetical protein